MNRNRGLFIVLLVVAGFLCICFSPFVHGQSKDQKNEESYLYLKEVLPEWIKATNLFVKEHLNRHPDCDIKIVDQMFIPAYRYNPNRAGWMEEGKIYINSNHRTKWTLKKFIVFKIHEDIHLTGRCLNDALKRYETPICRVFDRPIYYSFDINQAIEKHLKKELNDYENQIAVR